ncbi:MAG: FixH family protein [Thermodesulfovibrionales bacterium]|nr:FixH family protein [Thermodesulfovibrionales bacterium]
MKIITIILSMLLLTGIAFGKDYEVKKTVNGYEVVARIDKNPPSTGKNNITVTIKEAGKIVTDAKVTINYSMPAMPGMPPMDYKTDASLKGNEYAATMDLSMSGPWNIAIKIKRGDKTSTMKFNIDVR